MSVTTRPRIPPQDGVIKEAQERRSRRRLWAAITLLVLGALAAVGWRLGAHSSKTPTRTPSSLSIAAAAHAEHSPFNVRLYPAFEVGRASYCFVLEERGVTGNSACGGTPTKSMPFAMIFGNEQPQSGFSTTIAVTLPEVSTLIVNGKRRVPTSIVPGLSYGLRGAHIVTRKDEVLPPGMRREVLRAGIVLVPLNAAGQRLPEHAVSSARQGRVLKWSQPHPAPHGPCELKTSGLPGLRVSGGEVATNIRPYPGVIVGEGFVPCIEIHYRLGHEPVRALVLLNAADPSAPAGALPGFKAVAGKKGIFTEGAPSPPRAQARTGSS